ncbi:MAG TPA: MFS transporter [Candidatus Saccharimonas sp.]|nr:MFS transporter [Candidatus Saccharimonas sp.]
MKQHKWLILALLAAVQFMVVLDNSIVNVALPVLKTALHFSQDTLQWIIVAYTLSFGGFLLLGGRAADLFGRRRVLMTGMAGFTLISLLIGLLHSAEFMIALRSLQGLAAAFMSPAALSIVLNTFTSAKDRAVALGVWSSVGAGGAAAGLLIGGLLTQYLGWEWNFFINVPVGILVLAGLSKYVPAHMSQASEKNLDIPGALLVTSGLVALVFGLSEAPTWGWTSLATLGTIAASIVLLGAFIWNESRAKRPLMPLSIFRIRNITGANLAMMPVAASLYGMFFLISLYVETILHYTPVATGLAFLPVPIVLGATSNLVPRFIGKTGFKSLLLIGTALLAIGMFMLSFITSDSNYFTAVLPGLLLMAVGVGMNFVAINVSATAGVPANEAGLASGLIVTSQQLGGALGLAILLSVSTAAATSSLASGHAAAIAATYGYSRGFLIATGFAIISFLVGAFVIKQKTAPKVSAVAEPTTIH